MALLLIPHIDTILGILEKFRENLETRLLNDQSRDLAVQYLAVRLQLDHLTKIKNLLNSSAEFQDLTKEIKLTRDSDPRRIDLAEPLNLLNQYLKQYRNKQYKTEIHLLDTLSNIIMFLSALVLTAGIMMLLTHMLPFLGIALIVASAAPIAMGIAMYVADITAENSLHQPPENNKITFSFAHHDTTKAKQCSSLFFSATENVDVVRNTFSATKNGYGREALENSLEVDLKAALEEASSAASNGA